jgi:hypothetical protein
VERAIRETLFDAVDPDGTRRLIEAYAAALSLPAPDDDFYRLVE